MRFNVLLFWLRCYMVAETNDLPDKTSELNYVHNHPRGSAEWASASRYSHSQICLMMCQTIFLNTENPLLKYVLSDS